MANPYSYQHQVRVNSPMGDAPMVRAPRLGATNETMVEATAVDTPMAIGYVVGGLVGASLVGAGIGYLASGRQQGAITGAVAGAGISATTTALSEFFYGGNKVLGSIFGVAALGAMGYAWVRKPKG